MAQSSPSMTPQLPRVDSSPLYDHAVSPAPGSETELVAAAIFEFKMHRRQDELDHERWMRYYQRDRERHERWMRDHERDRERHRLRIETHRENSAGLQQLRRDMANSNSPRFSRRGTPTGTPVLAVDVRPKPAPRKTPTKACHTAPYQAADRHPGSAETTPPPNHVPVHAESSRARTSTVDSPAPHSATRSGEYDRERQSFISVRTSVTGSVTGSAGSVILSVTGSAGSVILSVTGSGSVTGSVTAYSALGSNGYVGL